MALESGHYAEYVTNVLESFHKTDVDRLCVCDGVIEQVGYRYYCVICDKSKQETVKMVMREMRELARLLIQFRLTATGNGLSGSDLGIEDMFVEKHIIVLYKVIDALTQGRKHSLMQYVDGVIKRTVKSLKGMYTEMTEDEKYRQLDLFAKVYERDSHELSDAGRFRSNGLSHGSVQRSPTQSRDEMLKNYVTTKIARLTVNGTCHGVNYTLLRSLVVCRLTHFSGTRGTELVQMTIKEWQNANIGEWIQETETGQYQMGQCKVTYIQGKGHRSIPVVIPSDCVKAIDILVAQRNENGITATNKFVFASKGSESHCCGWQAVRQATSMADMYLKSAANRRICSLPTGGEDRVDVRDVVDMDYRKVPWEDRMVPREDRKDPMEDRKDPMEDRKVPMDDRKGPTEDRKVPIKNRKRKRSDTETKKSVPSTLSSGACVETSHGTCTRFTS